MTIPNIITSPPRIDIAHQRIHEGNHFSVHKIYENLNVASPKYIMIIPPPAAPILSNTIEIHLIFQIETQPGGIIRFYENPTITNNGTELDTINKNRRSSTTSITKVFEDPIVTNDGTLLSEERGGTNTSGATIGEFRRNDEEIILNPIRRYIIKFIPFVDNTNATFKLDWYDNRPSFPVPI